MRRHSRQAVRTTISNPAAPCPLDRVKRQFTAERPNQLWVSETNA
ncbi:transposase [Acidihalobacter prosperus]|uniref:Transposase n=1 Tax=Acidihalobacter prosperus TaxID=160660 RepID=A0A1A6C597_9GAMM|nr:transposase [Acidihalobacter prosperus]